MKIQLQTPNIVIFESALFRTTTTLIIGEEYMLLIDPNWLPIEIEFIKSYIQNIRVKQEMYLAFTHSDYDHIIGYRAFEGYKTIASEAFVNNTDKGSIVDQIKDFDDANYIRRDYEIEYPSIDLVIDDHYGRLKIGEDIYCFYDARGHNQDGMLIHNETKNILVVGDYMSNIEFPYVYYSFVLYDQTLGYIENLIHQNEGVLLVPGHGDYTKDSRELNARIADSKLYLSKLKESVKAKKVFDFDWLFSKYQFKDVMTNFHNGNVKLLKKELETCS